MGRIIEKIKRLKPTKRKIIQLYMALLFNANLKGFMQGSIYQGNSKVTCVPGLNCYSCPGAIGACPLGSLQGSFSADKSTLFYVGGILLLYCILFGRFICGWLCPFGLIQELLHKIKTPKLKKNRFTKILSYLKYVILVVFVLIIPISYAFRDTPLPAFCKYICPAGTLEGGLSLLSNEVNNSYFSMLGPIFTWKFLLLVSIMVACIFIFRMFCRFICPLGALYGLFNKISIFGVKLDNSKCINCDLCKKKCQMDISHVGDMECISCGECIDVCPTNAISWKGIKTTKNKIPSDDIKSHKKARTVTRIVSAVLMLAVLVGSIAFYWNESSNKATYGTAIGDRCYSAELPIVTSEGISDKTINPTKTGKITIVNFWGTWCTPCIAELPYFDQIATNYKDGVTVVAVHSSLSCETSPEFVKNKYSDSNIIFANDIPDKSDTFNGEYYLNLGGSGTYPYTIILDEFGVIQEIFVKALHYEDLENAVKKIQN